MAAAALEEVSHLHAQLLDYGFRLAVGEAVEQYVALGIHSNAQARISVAAALPVGWDRAARLVAFAFFVHVL
jgi:hypothetical protein